MKCPICNNEMEEEFLQGMQRIAWVKGKHKLSLRPKKGQILLENNAFKDVLLSAQICKECQKNIVDYSDKDYQEGS